MSSSFIFFFLILKIGSLLGVGKTVKKENPVSYFSCALQDFYFCFGFCGQLGICFFAEFLKDLYLFVFWFYVFSFGLRDLYIRHERSVLIGMRVLCDDPKGFWFFSGR